MRRLFIVPLSFLFVFFVVETSGFLAGFSYEGSSFDYYLAFSLVFFALALGGGFSFRAFPCFYGRSFVSLYVPPVEKFLCFAFVGLIFIFIDRVYFQGISYSEGLAAARTLWQESSSDRGGVSSPFSVVGNILINCHYLAEILVLFYWETIRRPLARLVFVFLNVVFFSLLISGRTPLVVFLGLFFSTAVLRYFVGKGDLLPKGLRRVVLILVPLVFFIAAFIFTLRIDGSGIDANRYVVLLGERLYGVETDSQFVLSPVFRAVAVYIGHVKWVGINIFQSSIGYGVATFNEFLNIVATRLLGVGAADLVWQYDGLWVPMYAMVYYDLGWFGVLFLCLFCFFVMVLIPLFSVLPRTKSLSMSWPLVASIVLCVLILSPFQSPTEIVEFIYTTALACMLFLVALIRLPKV